MLGKLLGYEMKAYGRFLVPIYIALLALAGMLGLYIKFMPSWATNNIIFIFAVIIYVILLISVVVVTTILGINRYYGNLLGREGYFMFSLPTRTSTLMLSKTLSALIWTAFGTIVGFAAIMMVSVVAFNGPDFAEYFEAFKMVLEHAKPYIGNVILWGVIMIMAVVTIVMRVYAAVSIGSQWNGHRLVGSILAYIGIKAVEAVFANIMSMSSILEDAFDSLIGTGEAFASYRFQVVILAVILVQIVIFWLIAWFFTDRKLNLE